MDARPGNDSHVICGTQYGGPLTSDPINAPSVRARKTPHRNGGAFSRTRVDGKRQRLPIASAVLLALLPLTRSRLLSGRRLHGRSGGAGHRGRTLGINLFIDCGGILGGRNFRDGTLVEFLGDGGLRKMALLLVLLAARSEEHTSE